MANTVESNASSKHAPAISCPMCGSPMRLAAAQPALDKTLRLTFDCVCGLTYEMSEQLAHDVVKDPSRNSPTNG